MGYRPRIGRAGGTRRPRVDVVVAVRGGGAAAAAAAAAAAHDDDDVVVVGGGESDDDNQAAEANAHLRTSAARTGSAQLRDSRS